MIILRLLFFLTAIALAIAGGMYVFTGNRRYLRLAWEIVRFTVYALLIFLALYLFERYALIGLRAVV